MNGRRRTNWKEIMLGIIAGLSIAASPAAGQTKDSPEESTMRLDNRGHGSLNSGPGSLNSGHGSLVSGRDGGDQRGRQGGDDILVTQAGDARQEDRREDRRADRHQDRREDRQADRREDRRSDAGGELRGLDRADRVAGEHGRQGRANARDAQMMRANRPERLERPERVERPERPQRAERPERIERSGRN